MIQTEKVTALLMAKREITQEPLFERMKALPECEGKNRTNA